MLKALRIFKFSIFISFTTIVKFLGLTVILILFLVVKHFYHTPLTSSGDWETTTWCYLTLNKSSYLK